MTEYPGTVEERNRRLAHAGVARAETLLAANYGMSRQEAFDLLRRTSQRFNIKLHTLAETAARMPAPEAGGRVPQRQYAAAPPVPAVQARGERLGSDSAVLKAALHRTLGITGARMGNVQLVENGLLRIEKHTGLNRRFTDYFAFIETATTSCGQAAEESRQITVKDVAASDTFDETSRLTILQTGSRACHSVPLVGLDGSVVGMISSHHEQTLHGLTEAQLTALEQVGSQVGRWLSWHRDTAVRIALDHLHTSVAHRN
ncbi:GAF domain-containing protein [Streptomyces sp. NPDC086787]|uniref:GAF domain-containing protein n=1 Tax=Streptomyces sp. NPDC086787 TaxID=3365759 RepID=UPI00382DD8AC